MQVSINKTAVKEGLRFDQLKDGTLYEFRGDANHGTVVVYSAFNQQLTSVRSFSDFWRWSTSREYLKQARFARLPEGSTVTLTQTKE